MFITIKGPKVRDDSVPCDYFVNIEQIVMIDEQINKSTCRVVMTKGDIIAGESVDDLRKRINYYLDL